MAAVVALLATGSTVSAQTPLPLTQRLVQPGGFPPFLVLPGQSTTQYNSPQQWVALDTSLTTSQASAEVARMRNEGFVALVSRQLGLSQRESLGGLSWVMQLGSATAAKDELAANVQGAKTQTKAPGTFTAFKVKGIPGARGYSLTSSGGSGSNVVFAGGPFLYLLGVGWTQPKPKNTPTRAELVAAATRLYKRVHGHPST
jgi:hypothetical protein